MRIRWRGLELPNRVVSDRDTLTDTFAAVLARVAGNRINVSPGTFRRFVEHDNKTSRILLYDDVDGGSG